MTHTGNTMMEQGWHAPQRSLACPFACVKSDLEILLLMCP